MSKLTPIEKAMTDNTSWSPSYVAPSADIQVWKDGAFVPDQEPPKPAQWAGCSCATCASGRNRAYAPFTLEIDRLIAVLVHGSDEQKQQLKQLLDIE